MFQCANCCIFIETVEAVQVDVASKRKKSEVPVITEVPSNNFLVFWVKFLHAVGSERGIIVESPLNCL